MILSEKLLGYLKGEAFSTTEVFKYPTKIYPEQREDYLKKAVKGKKNNSHWLH